MDPVTQGALGAAVAQAVARRERAPWAALLGGVSGMAPDLDVLIRSPSDPLLFLEVHRQFTHALLAIPFGALLCAGLLFPVARRRLGFGETYLFCLAGFATHGLLDACTSYGTQLLWPFSDLRVAWNVVSVVDPLFTLPLLALVVAATLRRAPGLARIACAWALAVLLLGVVQRERAETFGRELAARRGHEAASLEAKPSFGNQLVWKTYYEADGRYHVDAVRLGWAATSFPGDTAPRLVVDRDLPWLGADTQQARDLERFRWFSSGYVALDPARADRVIDVRYSMVSNRI
ncbi:MAG: metal-dependent hydrolase, partial [Myxococcota bacterium]|nr:metal-dependent hydrolase [Myxococcota bacterium]